MGGFAIFIRKKFILESAYLDLQIVGLRLKLMFIVAAVVFPHS